MKLRSPFFLENLNQDQPYSSMLFITPYCDFKCLGCQNKHLADNDVNDFPVDELVEEYKNNPFVEGVTIGGLEVCFSGDHFLEDFIKFLTITKCPKVTIYSRFNLTNHYLDKLIRCLTLLHSVEELYLKTGHHVEDLGQKEIKLTKDWSITLSSYNQDFIKVK